MTKNIHVHCIPLNILNDLAARFIINIPKEDRQNVIRLMFQVELAHWFYIDEYASDASKFDPTSNSLQLENCTFRQFTEHIFKHVNFLKDKVEIIDDIIVSWNQYKFRVPTCGAILINETLTHVLLVKSYSATSSWGFPKGKVNEAEPKWKCAIREVFEETLFDVSSRLDKKQYIESKISSQITRYYYIPGVPSNTRFQAQSKFEIKDWQWFPIDGLPTHHHQVIPPNSLGLATKHCRRIIHVISELREWVSNYKSGKLSFYCQDNVAWSSGGKSGKNFNEQLAKRDGGINDPMKYAMSESGVIHARSAQNAALLKSSSPSTAAHSLSHNSQYSSPGQNILPLLFQKSGVNSKIKDEVEQEGGYHEKDLPDVKHFLNFKFDSEKISKMFDTPK